MRLKAYLLLLLSGTVLSWSGFFLVLNILRPDDMVSRIWFYGMLALALFGTLHLALFGWGKWRAKKKLTFSVVRGSERQAVALTGFVVSLLWLQTHAQLTWWIFMLAVIVLVVAEYVFLSYDEVS